jgi:DNA invertase Pin-like site-specific DNA recombinase
MNVAIYLRVSSKLRAKRTDRDADCQQQTENQKLQLERFAASQGWEITATFVDHDSGTKAARPGFTALMDAASRHEFDLVLVWALDRFSREGIGRTCDHLRRLAGWKVAFRSYSESFLDTAGPFAELVTALFAFFAAFEHNRIVERTVAGQQRAKAAGKQIGGFNKRVFHRDQVPLLRAQGMSLRAIATRLNVSKGTVVNVLKAA